ncbi:beta-lactamase/transpeptidase-like protein [Hypoxylon rubiginosum]|uniref:Beta-lactamase/transpeptidase-like protein n=1 Tax=Hypoxylon rubiginosum TaxID=110542 RepID=A0ACC0D8S6_9PEZI|nr:beta-lactamase/transpeptidase-like protein [Hypoxylon rubiginosum]
MTKLHTSVAVLQLVERGLITLDEDVSRFIPSFAKQKILIGITDDGAPILRKRQNPITLRHLLTHSAGAGYLFTSESLVKVAQWKNLSRKAGTVDEVFDLPLLYEPGEAFMYSSSVDRAGQVVEQLTGRSLEDYMRRHIWEPLGMDSTTFFPGKHPDIQARQAHMTYSTDNESPVAENPNAQTFTTFLREPFGGQGLFSSMRDYVKLLHSLLVDDEKVLKKETAAMMFQPQLSPASKSDLLDKMKNPWWIVGDYPVTGEYDWGLASILTDGDSHPYRKNGTLTWFGAANTFWFIDREAGVCGVFGTQVLPPFNARIKPLIKAFEEDVYRRAGKL